RLLLARSQLPARAGASEYERRVLGGQTRPDGGAGRGNGTGAETPELARAGDLGVRDRKQQLHGRAVCLASGRHVRSITVLENSVSRKNTEAPGHAGGLA